MGWMQRAVWIIEDVLRHHEQELQTIDLQIEAEKKRLEDDLCNIRARAYPRGIRYDVPRVQSSPSPDDRLAKIADDIQRRSDRANRIIKELEARRRVIEYIYDLIFDLDSQARCVLLTLYYPAHTYREAADLLGVDTSTIWRRKQMAIEALARKLPTWIMDVYK